MCDRDNFSPMLTINRCAYTPRDPYANSEECDPDLTAKEKQYRGAGILVFSQFQGKVLFLMARESKVARRTVTWSGFEGHRKVYESCASTAAREFLEESMGILEGLNTPPDVKGLLEGSSVFCKIYTTLKDSRTGTERVYVTYVVEVEYDPSLNRRFRDRRTMLKRVDKLLREAHLRTATETEAQHNARVNKSMEEVNATLAAHPVLFSEFPGLLRQTTACSDCESYEMEPNLESGKLTPASSLSVGVNPDVLEKDMVDYWEMDKLCCMLKQGGRVGRHRMRAQLIPTIHTAIEAVRSAFHRVPLAMGSVHVIPQVAVANSDTSERGYLLGRFKDSIEGGGD
jgi:hypothetical protein